MPRAMLASSVRTGPRNAQALVGAIQEVSRTVKGWLGAQARREGITMAMFWSLHTVASDGPVTVGQLAHSCGTTSANASMVVDDLTRAGLIERTRSLEDRRVVRLAATAKGRALIRTVWGHVSEGLAGSLSQLSEDEVATTARVLLSIARAADEHPVPPPEVTT